MVGVGLVPFVSSHDGCEDGILGPTKQQLLDFVRGSKL